MDIPRPSAARMRRIRRVLYLALALTLIISISIAVSRLEPAAPSVDLGTIWTGEVKRGSMVRQVRGSGRLVPEEIRWIPAQTSGRVERILLQPGANVTVRTVLLELSNPELDQSVLEAQSQLKQAEAELVNLQVQLESQLMTQKAEAARIESEYVQSQLQSEADQELAEEGLTSQLASRVSVARADSLATRFELEKQRLDIFSKAIKAQVDAKEAEVDQRHVLYQLRLRQRESLRVKPGIAGVLQQISVEVGQQVSPGTNLARVVEPERLKAEIRVAATQARDIQIGQKAAVDTRNGVIEGVVSRIDPAVEEGLVRVDIQLLGDLPRGARPDLPVDGTIELEYLDDIVYMPRPAFGQEDATASIFKFTPDGTHAVRVQARLGRSSVSTIEVLEGLVPGDQVILSDMSQWDEYDRVRID